MRACSFLPVVIQVLARVGPAYEIRGGVDGLYVFPHFRILGDTNDAMSNLRSRNSMTNVQTGLAT